MRRSVTIIGAAVAVLAGYMLWSRYLRFFGEFENGRYLDPETGRTYVERLGWMWGALLIISLLMIAMVRQK